MALLVVFVTTPPHPGLAPGVAGPRPIRPRRADRLVTGLSLRPQRNNSGNNTITSDNFLLLNESLVQYSNYTISPIFLRKHVHNITISRYVQIRLKLWTRSSKKRIAYPDPTGSPTPPLRPV